MQLHEVTPGWGPHWGQAGGLKCAGQHGPSGLQGPPTGVHRRTLKGAPCKTETEAESPGVPASAVPACLGGGRLLVGESLVMTPTHTHTPWSGP